MTHLDWTLYKTSDQAWEALYNDCLAAKKSIDLELYIFEIGPTGERFIELFKEKAQQGVKIRLILDAIGSRPFLLSSLPQELRSFGIQIQFFNPAYLLRFRHFTANFFRTHRKILIVDGAIAHLGSANIASSMKQWRETNIRFVGDAHNLIDEVTETFDHLWLIMQKKVFIPFPKNTDLADHFAIRTNAPHRHQRFIYRDVLAAIQNAKHHVYLTTPYFVPDFRFFLLLRKVAKKGIDVRLLMPSGTDHTIVDLAAESHYTLLLKSGVKIFRYTGGMLHAKTVIVDGHWATLGSFNLDNLSFLFNYEVNVVTYEKKLIADLTAHFMQDLTQAKEIDKELWYRRSFIRKFLEIMSWPIHQIL